MGMILNILSVYFATKQRNAERAARREAELSGETYIQPDDQDPFENGDGMGILSPMYNDEEQNRRDEFYADDDSDSGYGNSDTTDYNEW